MNFEGLTPILLYITPLANVVPSPLAGEGGGEWARENQECKAPYSLHCALTKETLKWGEFGGT